MCGYDKRYAKAIGMNMVEGNGKLWMALLNRNGICKIDKSTKNARIYKIFESRPLYEEFLYCCVEKVENYLIFSPGMAEEIAIVNLEDESITCIPLKKVNYICKEKQGEIKFWNIIRYQKSVYLLGVTYPAIIKLDMSLGKVEYITDWLEEVEKNIKEDDTNGYFSDGYVINNGVAIIPVSCMNAVLELDLETSRTQLRKLNITMSGIGGLSTVDGENIWLTGKGYNTNRLSCWNRQNGIIREIQLADLDESLIDPFYAPICTDKKVYLMPISAPHIYEVDINTGKVTIYDIDNSIDTAGKSVWPWKTISPKLYGNLLLFISGNDLRWHEYNTETGEHKSYDVYITNAESETKRYFNTLLKRNDLVFEDNISLKYFLDNLFDKNSIEAYGKSKGFSYGEKIHNLICREL